MFYGIVVAGWTISVTLCWLLVWLFFGGLISLTTWDSSFMSMSEWHFILRFAYGIVCIILTVFVSSVGVALVIDDGPKESFDKWFYKENENA